MEDPGGTYHLRRRGRDSDNTAVLYRRLEDLADVPGLLGDAPASADPMLTLQMMINGQRLNTFSTLASFGTAMDVGTDFATYLRPKAIPATGKR